MRFAYSLNGNTIVHHAGSKTESMAALASRGWQPTYLGALHPRYVPAIIAANPRDREHFKTVLSAIHAIREAAA